MQTRFWDCRPKSNRNWKKMEEEWHLEYIYSTLHSWQDRQTDRLSSIYSYTFTHRHLSLSLSLLSVFCLNHHHHRICFNQSSVDKSLHLHHHHLDHSYQTRKNTTTTTTTPLSSQGLKHWKAQSVSHHRHNFWKQRLLASGKSRWRSFSCLSVCQSGMCTNLLPPKHSCFALLSRLSTLPTSAFKPSRALDFFTWSSRFRLATVKLESFNYKKLRVPEFSISQRPNNIPNVQTCLHSNQLPYGPPNLPKANSLQYQ